MSKLILHVGTHKTGTTTIQDTFALNRSLLARNGLVFPRLGQTNGQHGLVTDWIKLPDHYNLDTTAQEAWSRLGRDHAKSDRTVLVSTEELSRGNPNSRVDLRRLRELVSDFDEVKIVCCLRNQVSFLQSIYLQVVKSGVHIPWGNFFEGAVGSRMATGLFLDYSDLRAHLETGFARSEIVFFSYEHAIKSSGGIIGRMMAECGLPHLTDSLQSLPAGHSNVSPDALGTWVAAHILGTRPFKPWLVDSARDALEDIGKGGMKNSVFSRGEYDRLKTVFEPLNRRFEATEAASGSTLTIGDFPKADSLVFRDALTPVYWVSLARRLVDKI